MISAGEIKKKAENKKSEYLKAKILEKEFFPLALRCDKGSILDDFDEREESLSSLFAQSKAKKQKGYLVETETKVSRTMGKQTFVSSIVIETEQDFLYLIKAEKQGALFSTHLSLLKATFSEKELVPWLLAKKMEIFSHWGEQDGIWFCQISRFLVANPNCGLFARELDVEAPTKFLENNLALIKSLVGTFRPLGEGDDDFTRLGLRKKESLVKIRSNKEFQIIVDGKLCGYTTILMLSPENFKTFELNVKRIFIVENETLFLTFPLQENDLCLYAGGYGILACKDSNLLFCSQIYYFGDLDEHGFAILDKFRALYGQTQSFCMDLKTLQDHQSYLVNGKTYPSEYRNLNTEELATLTALQSPQGPKLLEQEHISHSYLLKRLQSLTNG
jgi:hypothetical protein